MNPSTSTRVEARAEKTPVPLLRKCPLCYEKVVNLGVHVRDCHAVICPQCGALTVDLRRHDQQKHVPVMPGATRDGGRSVRCPKCGVLVKHLDRHLARVHSGVRRPRRCGRRSVATPRVLGLKRPRIG
jgi:hypothetical protein